MSGLVHIVVGRMENLRNKTWMLNHGVADDNVHYQHSMLLTRALEQADIQFVQHSYPDENHSLGGVSRYIQQVVNLVLTHSSCDQVSVPRYGSVLGGLF